MYTDPISDYLTRIRNANSAGHRVVNIPASKIKREITKITEITKKPTIILTEFKETQPKSISDMIRNEHKWCEKFKDEEKRKE